LTANSAVTPTANGYAIASYDTVDPLSTPTSVAADDIVKFVGSGKVVDDITSITPSSTPTSVSSGDNIHIGGSGEIVSSITNIDVASSDYKRAVAKGGNYHIDTNSAEHGYIVGGWSFATPSDSNPPAVTQDSLIYPNAAGYLYATQQPIPSSLTPSNSSPATITSGETYTATANGKAVASVINLTPSNSSPVALTANTPVNPTASGYAISSYSSKTPSDSSPASVSSGAIIKAMAAGYLYASSGLGKCKAGTFTSSTSAQTITLGFQPKYILIMSTALTTNIYNSSYNASKAVYATSSAGATEYTISGNTSNNHISAISSTGFTFNKSGSSGTTIYYFAIG
jgi:hypothetical protein